LHLRGVAAISVYYRTAIRIVMQKIIIASDSFKDSLDAPAVCAAIHRGIQKVLPRAQIQEIPLGDGGEGTARLLTRIKQAEWIPTKVEDPLGRPIHAGYGWNATERTAYLDMAEASGLQHLSSKERDPFLSSTFGFGQLLKQVLLKSPQKILIGIGGSATSEGGIGMATALGYQFIDKNGKKLTPNGANLSKIEHIFPPDQHPVPANCSISILCDVNNPLYGPQGAAPVFAEQKGATPGQIKELDKGLKNLAEMIQRDLNINVHQLAGGGAAGGLGAGLVAFANAELRPGIDCILEMVDFQNFIQHADVLITGEGKLDAQTGGGKLIQGICRKAALEKVPVIALCGSLQASPEEIQGIGLQAAFSILSGPMSLTQALPQTSQMLEETAEHLFRVISLTKA